MTAPGRRRSKLEEAGAVAREIAHDMRNQITVAMAHLDLLAVDCGPTEPASGHLERLGQALDRLARLTERLLTGARRAADRSEPLDLDAIIADLAGPIRHEMGPGTTLETALGSGGAVVFADRAGLEQVVMNLARNGIEAMPHGGPLTVSTRLVRCESVGGRPARPFIELSMRDAGVGMTPETAQRATEPFFTTREEDGGSGIGLSLVERFARRCRGWVEIDSTPGDGTLVLVLLPATPPDGRTAEAVEPPSGG